MKNIEFINARQKAKDFPDTFKLFDESELKNLKKDDSIKVMLKQERFWINFIKFENDNIIGTINNVLIVHSLKENEIVSFSKDCVIDIFSVALNELVHNGKNSVKINEEIQSHMKFISNNIRIINTEYNRSFFLNLYNKYK